VATKTSTYLGEGLYTVAEAALYCRVSTAVMGRWLFGTKAGKAVLNPQFGGKERFVSFLDLVQTLAIREIRNQHRVPLTKFRQAIQLAKTKLDLEYPFARQHCTFLLGDTLVIRPDPDKENYFEASGKQRGQQLLPFVEMYLTRLKFNPEGLAHKYRIFESRHPSPVAVTMDPHVRFGERLHRSRDLGGDPGRGGRDPGRESVRHPG
jgi:hypothetical protein